MLTQLGPLVVLGWLSSIQGKFNQLLSFACLSLAPVSDPGKFQFCWRISSKIESNALSIRSGLTNYFAFKS